MSKSTPTLNLRIDRAVITASKKRRPLPKGHAKSLAGAPRGYKGEAGGKSSPTYAELKAALTVLVNGLTRSTPKVRHQFFRHLSERDACLDALHALRDEYEDTLDETKFSTLTLPSDEVLAEEINRAADELEKERRPKEYKL